MDKSMLLVLSLVVTFISTTVRAQMNHHGHSHDHGHSHGGHDHGHSHGHGHDDHIHAGHGHSHEHLGDHDNFHEHDDHFHEPAHLKYSREANQAAAEAEKVATSKKPATQQPKKEQVVKAGSKDRQTDLYDKNGFLFFMNNPSYRIWVYSIGSTLLISAAPFFILFFIPIDNNKSPESSPFLKVLLSFASGGLLGDALLHLIPHSLYAKQADEAESCHDHGHSHESQHGHSHGGHGHSHGPGHTHDMNVGMYVLMGITTFLIIEKLVRIVKGDGHGHGHSHGDVAAAKQSRTTDEATKPSHHHKHHGSDEDVSAEDGDSGNKDEADTGKGHVARSGGMELRQRKKPSQNASSSTSRSPKREKTDSSKPVTKQDQPETDVEFQDIKVAGYLNLAADFAHNFTDGLAVGASYMAGTTVGLVTTLTVLVHEIPHEIGDFAILIQSGCSKKNAMLLQLVTAFGALLGCCISLSTSDPDGVAHAAESSWVLPFTAGGFIYVATVSVIPELLENSGLWQSIKEIAALFVGIGMMVLIAKFE